MKYNTPKKFIRRIRNFISYKIFRLEVKIDFFFSPLKIFLLKKFYKIFFPSKKFIVIALVEYIGDIIPCEPIIRYLRKTEPEAILVWVVKKTNKDLVKYHKGLDFILSVRSIKCWDTIKCNIKFDKVYDLHMDNKYCEVTQTYLNKEHPSPINFRNYFMYGNSLSLFCQVGGLPVLHDGPKLFIPSKVFRSIKRFNLPDSYICFHAVSKDESKDWEYNKWQQVVWSIIENLGMPIVEIGMVQTVSLDSEFYFNLCSKSSLLESAAIIRKAKLFVGVDSGPAHIANAVGTYGIILLGYKNTIKHYTPFSGDYENHKNATIICPLDGNVKSILVADVYNEIVKRLNVEPKKIF